MTNQSQDRNLLADHLGEYLEHALDDIEGLGSKDPQPVVGSVTTGFRDLDALTFRLRPGTLTVIASRPSMGRTTLLSDICRANAMRHDTPVAVYTLEESGKDFALRVLSAEARVGLHLMRSGNLDEDDWKRLAKQAPAVAAAPHRGDEPARH